MCLNYSDDIKLIWYINQGSNLTSSSKLSPSSPCKAQSSSSSSIQTKQQNISSSFSSASSTSTTPTQMNVVASSSTSPRTAAGQHHQYKELHHETVEYEAMPPPPPPPAPLLPQLPPLPPTLSSSSFNSGAKNLSKLKRFLTTLQQFAADISPETGDRVKSLVLNLVVSILYTGWI